MSGFYDQRGGWVPQGGRLVDPFEEIDRHDAAAARFERDPQERGEIGPANTGPAAVRRMADRVREINAERR